MALTSQNARQGYCVTATSTSMCLTATLFSWETLCHETGINPQSKEGDERIEEKLDLLIKQLDTEHAQQLLKQIEEKYLKK